jgi:hypothetical protein
MEVRCPAFSSFLLFSTLSTAAEIRREHSGEEEEASGFPEDLAVEVEAGEEDPVAEAGAAAVAEARVVAAQAGAGDGKKRSTTILF